MAGFFKKLFNRIVGKPTEEVKPVEVEQVALPAPEPEPVVETVKPVKKPAPQKPEPKKVAKAKPVVKVPAKAPAKAKGKVVTPQPKKVEVKKPVAKTVAPKKPAPQKPEAKMQEPKAKPAPVAKVVVETERPPPRLTGRFAAFASAHPHRGEGEEKVVIVPPPPPPKPAPVPEPVVEAPVRGGWFSRLKEGLSKSSKTITGSITAIFTKRKLDKETLQELEDTLIQADLGLAVSERIIAAVSHGRYDKEIDPEEVKAILASEVAKVLKPVEVPFNFGTEKPYVILVVGVNGSGKTTTIGKLGSIAASEGFKVMFAACDTFRAAAVEQLTVWGKRVGAITKSAPTGADSAGLAFDALKQAREDGTDILFIDTAGRLQNKAYLMDELDKVVRVIKKMDAAAPHAVLLVLDATTGQNALAQAEVFTKVAGVTGLIMTKLDGTARGGILVAIAEKFKLPIHAIGVGESIDDLQPFDAVAFSRAIAGFED
jgi:fused signal recognition particle receptor